MLSFLFKRKDSRTTLNNANPQNIKEEIKRKHRIDKFNQALIAAKKKKS